MSSQEKDRDSNRVTLPESINASLTRFLTSWWILFALVPFVSLLYLPDFENVTKSLLVDVSSRNTRGNFFMLSVVAYFFVTIAVPFTICYFFWVRTRKRQRQ